MNRPFKFSERGIALIQMTVVILVICMLILLVGYTHSMINLNVLIVAASLWTLIASAWLIKGQFAPTPLKIPLLIWVAVYAISVILSMDPRRSAGQMLIMTASVFLFLLTYDLVSRGWQAKSFIKGILISSSIIIFITLFNTAVWYRDWLAANPGDFIPSINYRPAMANSIASFTYLVAILGITFLFYARTKFPRFAFIALSGMALLLLYISSSRGGWLATAAGFAVLFAILIWQRKINLPAIYHFLMARRVLMAGAIILVLGVVLGAGFVLARKSIHPTHGGFFSSRESLWMPAINTFLAHPIFGQGPFTYGSSFLAATSAPPGAVYIHAHSVPLNLLAEMGIAGFFSLGFLIYSIFRHFYARIKNYGSALPPILIATVAYLAAYFIHSFFDSLVLEPALAWSMVFLLAISCAIIEKRKPQNRVKAGNRPWWVVVPVVLSWVGVWMLTPFHEGIQLASQGQWLEAREQFSIAVHRDPYASITHQQLAIVDTILAQEGNAPYIQEAIHELEIAITMEPSWALNHANLAALYAQSGNFENALAAAQRSVELAPRMPLYALNMGWIAEKKGDSAAASFAYQMALTAEPSWASAAFWQKTPTRKLALSEWLASYSPPAEQTLEERINLLAQNQQSAWAYNQLAQGYLELGQILPAQETLDNARLAYTSQPVESIETRWLQAEILAAQGDFASATLMGEEAIRQYQSYSVYGPGSFGILYYAPRVFRSAAIAVEIVPQMVEVPVPEVWVEREKQLDNWNNKFSGEY